MKVLVTAISVLLFANCPAYSAETNGVRYDALPDPPGSPPYVSPAPNSSQTSGRDPFGSGKFAPVADKTKMNTVQATTLAPESAEVKAAWQQWHGCIAQEIQRRFVSMANTAFNNSGETSATVSYTVTRDGRITQVHLIHKSPNPVFNAIAMTAITSLNTNMILRFPAGSTQTEVEKIGSFSINGKSEFPSGQVGDFEPEMLHYPRPTILHE
jgi:outer membrane biosynthesis protein TonB